MKYVLFTTVCVLLIFPGCGTGSSTEGTAPQMELVNVTSLPTLPERFPTVGLKLNVVFRVLDNGSVAEVKMLSTSGDDNWDHAAADSMKLWHFTPSTQVANPTGRWMRNVIVVQVQEPTLLPLGQIAAASKQEADSLYTLLEQGTEFDNLLKQLRPGTKDPFGIYFGTINIARFPHQVRVELQRLRANNYTEPIRVGTNYFIYKRYGSDGSNFVPQ